MFHILRIVLALSRSVKSFVQESNVRKSIQVPVGLDYHLMRNQSSSAGLSSNQANFY